MADSDKKIIDESNYSVRMPKASGPSAVGKGGDPLFMNIRASKKQLEELLDETATVQDWIQKETCNNIALSCLDNENLKELYFEMKDGFGDYGPMILMGFKTPLGVEIPRLKILDKNGEILDVLTGPQAIDELNRRAVAFKECHNSDTSQTVNEIIENGCEIIENIDEEAPSAAIEDYSGNPDDYA